MILSNIGFLVSESLYALTGLFVILGYFFGAYGLIRFIIDVVSVLTPKENYAPPITKNKSQSAQPKTNTKKSGMVRRWLSSKPQAEVINLDEYRAKVGKKVDYSFSARKSNGTDSVS